jgi:sugar phosphate permease
MGAFFRATFIAATLSNVSQGLAFFLQYLACSYLVKSPSFALYMLLILPAYALDLALSATEGALILALMNVTQIFGQLGIGYLSDQINFHILLRSTICSATVAFLVRGFSNGFGQFLAFGLLYGLFGWRIQCAVLLFCYCSNR